MISFDVLKYLDCYITERTLFILHGLSTKEKNLKEKLGFMPAQATEDNESEITGGVRRVFDRITYESLP